MLNDAAWVLLGVMLGTGTWIVLVDQPLAIVSSSVVPMASMTVFGMLVSSVHGDRGPSHVRH